MPYAIGIDQGGTKTAAVIVSTSGEVVGWGKGPGACHSTDGMDAAMRGVSLAVQAALDNAEMAGFGSISDIIGLVGGMAGADWPHEYVLLASALAKTVPCVCEADVTVVNDSIIALRAGTTNSYGAVVIAGTEANIAVVSPHGNSVVLGYYLGEDYLGGRALGRQALRAVFDAKMGFGPKTVMTQLVLDHFGVSDEDTLLMRYSLGLLGDDVKTASLPLFEASLLNDPVAIDIATKFGRGLGRYVVSGMEKVGIRQHLQDHQPIEIVTGGSIFKAKTPVLIESLLSAVKERINNVVLTKPSVQPVAGAAVMAVENGLRKTGQTMSADMGLVVKTSAQKIGLGIEG